MENTHSNNVGSFKGSLFEFFKPLTDLIRYIKYLSEAPSRSKEMFIKLQKIEHLINDQSSDSHDLALRLENLSTKLYGQTNVVRLLKDEIKRSKNLFIKNELLRDLYGPFMFSWSSTISKIINNKIELMTRPLIPGNQLTNAAAEIGIANIEYLLNGIIEKHMGQKPHLFGINKGGALLANYLAHRLDLHQKYLVKCDYREDHEKLICEERDIDGPIVILDDVVRSGTTLKTVKQYVKDTYPNSETYSFILVMSCNEERSYRSIANLIDYTPWITNQTKVRLPWSSNRKKDIKVEEYFDDVEMDQVFSRLANTAEISKQWQLLLKGE